MTSKQLRTEIESAVALMLQTTVVKFGTLVELEMYLAEGDYQFPLLWFLPVQTSQSLIPSSSATIDTQPLSGIALVEYDVDSTNEDRLTNDDYAESVIRDFFDKIDRSSNILIQSNSLSPIYRMYNSVSQGRAFTLTIQSWTKHCC